MITIILDPNYSPYVVKSREYNRMLALNEIVHLNDLLKYRGYLYLNQIYENLMVKWDPKKENTCWTTDEYSTVNAELKDYGDHGILISISVT